MSKAKGELKSEGLQCLHRAFPGHVRACNYWPCVMALLHLFRAGEGCESRALGVAGETLRAVGYADALDRAVQPGQDRRLCGAD